MILDGQLLFTSGAAAPYAQFGDTITASGNSSNIIDLHILAPPGVPVLASGQGARDIGIGDDPALKILVQCLTTFATGTSLIVALQGSPDNGSGAPAGFVTWYTSGTVALASLVAGARLMDMDMPRPPAGQPVPRFLQLNYTVGGSNFTGPSVLIGTLVLDRMDQMYQSTVNSRMGGYPAGITVAN